MPRKSLLVLLLVVFQHHLSAQKKNTVAIIGGGMAGISAAYHIRQADPNAEIVIFEKESKLGGNAITIPVKNSLGKTVNIDIGPQYFTEGPWDDYLQFLKENGVYNDQETDQMIGSIVIKSSDTGKPVIITPIAKSLRGEKIGKLLKFKKFNSEAHQVFKNPEKWTGVTVEAWVEQTKFDAAFKTTILYPFLAASLGTSVIEIKKVAVSEIVKLFAFRKPRRKDTFKIMQKGMGGIIGEIGVKLSAHLTILTDCPVTQIKNHEKGISVSFVQKGDPKELDFDYVVSAVHADQAYKLLKNDVQFTEVCNELKELKYFEAKIILHTDTNFASPNLPAFLNIYTDKNDEVTTSTMNLGLISEDLSGIYKSWMPDATAQKLKAGPHFIHEYTFYHPLITTGFVNHLANISKLSKNFRNFSIIGGWAEGLETQNSAVLSGRRACLEYINWKNQKP